MMKRILYTLTLFLLVSGLKAQTISGPVGSELLETVPPEQIFVHYNSSLLFPGEYLYYKIYNLNTATGTASKLSKVGYLEIVGEQGEQVFQHMVPLENGQGHGDYFIPVTLPSGSYKLLAYTQWMKNHQNYFEADLVVINPYQGDQAAVSPTAEKPASGDLFVSPSEIVATEANTETGTLSMELDKQLYHPREQVRLTFANSKSHAGNYSVSVRRVDSIRTPSKPAPEPATPISAPGNGTDKVYLPEFRGDLISGRITPLPSATSRSRRYVKIAFSIPGEKMLYKVATTNEKGAFYISFDEPRSSPEVFMQIIGDDKDFFEIKLDELPSPEPSQLSFYDFKITPEMEQWILDRSVQNQIENAYYNQKPDTIVIPRVETPFYVKQPDLYVLDDFNRFASIEETFVEIIKSAWISKSRSGDHRIVVREPNGGRNYGLPALLLVDGVMVQDHAKFISYPAKNVESIGILRDNFYIGSHIFEGIIDIHTFGGRYWEENPEQYIFQKEIKIPEPQKQYFQQSYDDSAKPLNSSLPDLRTQLLWKPDFSLGDSEPHLDFYTSDVTGIFEIEVKGFTSSGEPVVLKKYFRVEE